MEAAPKLPMISFELFQCKETVQFGKKLKPYITQFYHEDPETFSAEIQKLDALRISATHPVTTDVTGLSTLKRYYCQLSFLKARFPMEHDQPCFIKFDWRYYNDDVISGDVNFELAAILMNTAILHTILGKMATRTSQEGMKSACAHFQCALWAFGAVTERHNDVLSSHDRKMTALYRDICLAQAQECILEKSMLDNRKSSIVAKVAVQVADFYRQAQMALSSVLDDLRLSLSTSGSSLKKFRDMELYLKFKMAYAKSVACLFHGQMAEELQKMGERCAWFQLGHDNLTEAVKTIGKNKELEEAVAFTMDVVEGKRNAAKNENEFIYHEEVPKVSELNWQKGAVLVKGIEFDVNDTQISGLDIFARLVPMETHEAASIYSERKAETLRTIGARIERKNTELAEFLSSLQLDQVHHLRQFDAALPQEVIDRAAALSARPTALQDLTHAMATLSDASCDVDACLRDIDVMLEAELEAESEYQRAMGQPRPPNQIITDLRRETTKYHEAHARAQDSNETLSRAMKMHLEQLRMLRKPIRELEAALPHLTLPDSNVNEMSINELRRLTRKVEEMRTQRALVHAQLRDALRHDDVTQHLVTRPQAESLDHVFERRLNEHRPLIDILEQNLTAQDNVKRALIDSYAASLTTRRYLNDLWQRRAQQVAALLQAYDSYDDLLAKAQKGGEFYRKLHANVVKLMQKLKGALVVQREERAARATTAATNVNNLTTTAVTPFSVSISSSSTTTSSAILTTATPKLKDYLDARKLSSTITSGGGASIKNTSGGGWGIRPTPLGSELPPPPLNSQPMANNYYYPQQEYYNNPAHPNNVAMMANSNYLPPPSVAPSNAYNNYYQHHQSSINSTPIATTTTTTTNLSSINNPAHQTTNLMTSSQLQYNNYGNYVATMYNNINAAAAAPSKNHVMMAQNYRQQQQQTIEKPSSSSSSSNIDLLTGVDFSIPPPTSTQNILNPAPVLTPTLAISALKITPTTTTTTTNENQATTGAAILEKTEKTANSAPFVVDMDKIDVTVVPKLSRPFDNDDVINLFKSECGRFDSLLLRPEATVEGGGASTLLMDQWKLLNDSSIISGRRNQGVTPTFPVSMATPPTISVARCYPMKNRNPDVLPYDFNRIKLRHAADDYINASLVTRNVTDDRKRQFFGPISIITQVPFTAATRSDFWLMVAEQQVEIIVCLMSDEEFLMGGGAAEPYWPTERGGRGLSLANQTIELTLQSDNVINSGAKSSSSWWRERVINVNMTMTDDKKKCQKQQQQQKRDVLLVQFTQFPNNSDGLPEGAAYVDFVQHLLELHQKQRKIEHPMIFQCQAGIGRSGVTCLMMHAILEATNEARIPDFCRLTRELTAQRRNLLKNYEHFRFAHEVFQLYMHKMANIPIIDETVKMSKNDSNSSSAAVVMVDPLDRLNPFFWN